MYNIYNIICGIFALLEMFLCVGGFFLFLIIVMIICRKNGIELDE
jgi:hypothetical protein